MRIIAINGIEHRWQCCCRGILGQRWVSADFTCCCDDLFGLNCALSRDHSTIGVVVVCILLVISSLCVINDKAAGNRADELKLRGIVQTSREGIVEGDDGALTAAMLIAAASCEVGRSSVVLLLPAPSNENVERRHRPARRHPLARGLPVELELQRLLRGVNVCLGVVVLWAAVMHVVLCCRNG